MRILIDIGHPAHVHLFKNFVMEMRKKGHKVLLTCIDREFILYLLNLYNFDYYNFGKHYKSISGKVLGLVKNEFKMLIISLKFRPDLFLCHGSAKAAFTSLLLNKPHIAFEDTFNMEQVRLYLPFTDVILTGDYPHTSLGKKEIKYPGYHELAYLHPNVFTPDESVLEILGMKKGEKYAIVRFVAWEASHDIGHSGISYENKVKLVQTLSQHLRVFISSEKELPEELKKYQINIPPEQMHNALAFAHLFIGESGTMASESAVLGTPAIFINNQHFGCIDDQANYGLLFIYSESENDQISAIKKAEEIAIKKNVKEDYLAKKEKMLADKIDVSAFLIWFIENYPESVKEVKRRDFDFGRFKSRNNYQNN
jgi:predicted glycosyltransferase